jgi:hypothetical protein
MADHSLAHGNLPAADSSNPTQADRVINAG